MSIVDYTTHLPRGCQIDNKYTVVLFIRKGRTTETYRVKDEAGNILFLKLIQCAKLDRSDYDSDMRVLEIEITRSLIHPNTIQYKDSGEWMYEGKKYMYLVLPFIVGETLAQKMERESLASIYDVIHMAEGILLALDYLHSLPMPVIHNEITPSNIMLDMSEDIIRPILINFGYARMFYASSRTYKREGLNLFHVASECITNNYSPQSDLFSLGTVIYTMLYGMPPWFFNITKYQAEQDSIADLIIAERRKSLALPNIALDVQGRDARLHYILNRALQEDPDKRFQSAKEFLDALRSDSICDVPKPPRPPKQKKESNSSSHSLQAKVGFAAIAGMTSLKEELRIDVINYLKNPEKYREHHLTMPNGILLYGPPGCGKTFFAERFAEEAGYYFIKVRPSDIASIYVHGTQQKIAKLFEDARVHAPTILFFDELDAIAPHRDNISNQSESGEVNELLTQLDNIGSSGVFIIGSTNRPDAIDKAVLRSGRLEKWFFVPPPDVEARKALFELYLEERPLALGIDYERLASLAENYVASDIKLLVDEASRKTIREDLKRITMKTLLSIFQVQKPTIPATELKRYELIRRRREEGVDESATGTRPIGFKI